MISIEGVSKAFFDHPVLQNISFHLKKGESCSWIGPSGEGKTLLMKIVAALVQPDIGTVQLKSTDIGMLFQRNALFDSLTVQDNLLFPLKERLGITGAKAHAQMTEYLNAVGLAGTGHLFPDELSGGMQKRLGIARALILKPAVILYDEPTAGLDPITSRTIAELILSLQKSEGSTFIAITNDMSRAIQLGTRIAYIGNMTLVDLGTPDEALTTKTPHIYKFIHGHSLKEGPTL